MSDLLHPTEIARPVSPEPGLGLRLTEFGVKRHYLATTAQTTCRLLDNKPRDTILAMPGAAS